MLLTNLKPFLNKATGAGLSTLLHSASLFVRLKFIAIVFGAQGVGLLSIVQAHQNIFSGLAGLSAGNAFTRDIAKDRDDHSKSSPKNLSIYMAVIFGGILSIIAGFLWVLLYDQSNQTLPWFFVVIFAVFSAANINQVTYILRGLNRIDSLVKVSSLIFSISTFLFFLFYISGFDRVWIFFMAIPISTSITLFITPETRKLYSKKIFSTSGFDLFNYLKNNNISALFFSAIFVTVSQLVYRLIIGDRFGLAELGYFQTAWMFSALVMMVNTSIMSSVYLPTISDKSNLESKKIFMHTSRQIFLNLFILGTAFIAFYYGGHYFIKIVASDELLPAISIVFVLFCVDAIRCIVSPLGYLVFSKGDVVGYVGIDIIGGLLSLIILFFYFESLITNAIFWSQGIAAIFALIFILSRLSFTKSLISK